MFLIQIFVYEMKAIKMSIGKTQLGMKTSKNMKKGRCKTALNVSGTQILPFSR